VAPVGSFCFGIICPKGDQSKNLGGVTKGSGTPQALLDASDQEGAVIFCAKLDTKILKDWEKESKSGFPERNSDREKEHKKYGG